jgi:hypothetical protein
MSQSCPISYIKVNETFVRLQAVFISLLGISFLIQTNIVWLLILLYDFSVRLLGYKKASPFYFINLYIINIASLPSHIVDAGPKQFAAKLGLFFVISALILYLLGFPLVSSSIIGILTICAFFEAWLGLCVGCVIYPFFKKIF